jgi:hypothetical protein
VAEACGPARSVGLAAAPVWRMQIGILRLVKNGGLRDSEHFVFEFFPNRANRIACR